MNDEVLNMQVRKFLKYVGVTSQREIENAVRKAVAAGRVKGNAKLTARMTLTIEKVDLNKVLKGTIALE